jgi:hypothetical protein
MTGETNNQSTGVTPTTNETTTPPAGGSETVTDQKTNDTGGIIDSLGTKPAAESADGANKKPEDKPTGAPEKYEAWKVPEGYELDAKLVEQASPIFKELGLTQEQSQKLVDFYATNALADSKRSMDAWLETRRDWVKTMKSDETLGKLKGPDGNFGPDSKLVKTVNMAMDGLQNPQLVADFKAALNLTGAGDNPAVVRVLYALASQVSEGTEYAKGNPTKPASGRPSPGAAMYPNLKPASET